MVSLSTRRVRFVVAVLFGYAFAAIGPAAAEPVARVPFELVESHTFIDVRVNGESLSFVFDTGASNMSLNQATARRLGLKATGRGTATGAGGRTAVPRVSGLTLDVGSLHLSGASAGLLPFEHLEEMAGRTLDGIIGGPILRGRVVVIDYDRRLLEVYARSAFPAERWGTACRLESGSGLPQVWAEIRLAGGEGLHGRFFVDSGAGFFLALSKPFVSKHGLADRVGGTHVHTRRALTGKPIPSRVGRLAGVRVCGYELPPPELLEGEAIPVILSGATAGVLARDGLAGLIGNEIWKRFNMALDLDRESLYLRPNGHWRDPIRTDGSGLILVRKRDGTVRIAEVIVPSPAAEAGLETGDAIRAVDSSDASAMTLAAIRESLKGAGRKATLEVARGGETRTVSLALRTLGRL